MTLEAAILTGATLVAGAIGVLLGYWYNRGKPWLGLSSIQRDDRYLVAIPEHLCEISKRCHWTPAIEAKATSLSQLIHLINETEEDIPMLRSSLDTISEFEKDRTSDPSDGQRNRNLLTKLIEDRGFVTVQLPGRQSTGQMLRIPETQKVCHSRRYGRGKRLSSSANPSRTNPECIQGRPRGYHFSHRVPAGSA